MRNTFDEATLTAYALGELSEAERAEVEARLAESEELRRELEEIRATAAVLRETFAAEPRAELDPAQRAAVEAEARKAPVVRFPMARFIMTPATLAAAAALVLAVLASALLRESEPTRSSPRVADDSGRRATPSPSVTPASPTPVVAATPEPAASVTPAPVPATTPARTSPSAGERGVVKPRPSGPAVAPAATPSPAAVPPTPAPPAPPPSTAVSGPMVASALRGTVTDPAGGVVPGATVVMTSQSTSLSQTRTSDAKGNFYFAGVNPGLYTVDTAMPGFKNWETKDLRVGANDTLTVAVKLPVGDVTETISVVADSEMIQTSSGVRQGLITQDQIESLSMTGRNPLELVRIVPGVVAANAALGSAQVLARPSKGEAFSINGPRPADLGVDLDSLRERSADFTTEAYDHIRDNPFILVSQDPRSTFSVDVDTASYSIMRRFLTGGSLPPKDAVRIEELINYFRYDYAPPAGPHPFAVHMETASCPWKPAHRLVRIGLKGRELPRGKRPPSNLVFLLDVSGSMQAPNKLPLVQSAMKLLVNELGPQDRVAIVVYAGAEGLALPSTPATDKPAILNVLDQLSAGGTTHASAGIKLAYETAAQHFIKGGVNRVILATDGDFNVGVTNQGELIRLIEEQAKGGVFLTALGFGMGNLKDSTLEKLADKGNGNYAYIDGLWEARKVLVEQMGATLVTIAKDVKLQLELNPTTVKAFRLIGYENRILAHQDFNDDKKDAGDIGAGHTVTALYEIVPAGGEIDVPGVDPLKYQEPTRPNARAKQGELLSLKLRYKLPDGDQSTLMEVALKDDERAYERASTDFRFAAAVASFGMILRDSPYKGSADLAQTLKWAKASLGADEGSLRAELLTLIEKARGLSGSK